MGLQVDLVRFPSHQHIVNMIFTLIPFYASGEQANKGMYTSLTFINNILTNGLRSFQMSKAGMVTSHISDHSLFWHNLSNCHPSIYQPIDKPSCLINDHSTANSLNSCANSKWSDYPEHEWTNRAFGEFYNIFISVFLKHFQGLKEEEDLQGKKHGLMRLRRRMSVKRTIATRNINETQMQR